MAISVLTLQNEKAYGDFRDQLFRDGYAVVKGATSTERADAYKEAMIQWLERFPLGFNRHDPNTWTEDYLPANMKGGMYHGYAVAHEDFVWEARQYVCLSSQAPTIP
jgi:hypothetical protein